jgi:hypothetical protein
MHKPHTLLMKCACSNSTGKSFTHTEETWHIMSVCLAGKTIGPESWSPKMPTKTLIENYIEADF